MGINKIILIGHLGRDPEKKTITLEEAAALYRQITGRGVGRSTLRSAVMAHFRHLGCFHFDSYAALQGKLVGIKADRFKNFVATRQALRGSERIFTATED